MGPLLEFFICQIQKISNFESYIKHYIDVEPYLLEESVLLTDNYAPVEFLSLEEIAGHDEVDTVIVATSGTAGLGATLAAVEAGKNVALANKESLVSAGEIIMSAAERSGSKILPAVS